jgi:hypothetical protein
MNDLSESNGHDNLGFGKERTTEADTTSHSTTVTNVSNSSSANATPRSLNGKTRKNSNTGQDTTKRSVSTEVLNKRKSISGNTKETSFNSHEKLGNKKTTNKETMKYAKEKKIGAEIETSSTNKKHENKKSGNKKIKNKEDHKETKEILLKQPDQNSDKPKTGLKTQMADNGGTEAPKKKVKIKESLSQKIKKSNSGEDDKKNILKTVKKQHKSDQIHKRNVKYLLDQATEANEHINKKSGSSKDIEENKTQLEHQPETLSVINKNISNDQPSPKSISDVNHSIIIHEKSNGKIRTLERVETEDTSIDTSTLPPPLDETPLSCEEEVHAPTEERFIA